ncbi:hypothetical protein TD95_000259 [Thielaviopsis punctulata]|uniref:mitogen-activated protein kinase n=1 Tax=Thielaviopsis punctulata TaxID=72032 RepID=A0A0F4ZF76_9PEZI|nr:hypothetical protein TD95_000259 [Thielaviopsis punctulata]
MYQGNQRHDQSRGYQVPPPPPPMSLPTMNTQTPGMIMPPPPPLPRYNTAQSGAMVLPPPPPPLPNTTLPHTSSWSSYVNRANPPQIQAYNPRLHAQITGNMSMGGTAGSSVSTSSNPLMNPTLAAAAIPGAILPPPPPLAVSPPSSELTMSATYIPSGGTTFGVGIPSLTESDFYSDISGLTLPPTPGTTAAPTPVEPVAAPVADTSYSSISVPASRGGSSASTSGSTTISPDLIAYWSIERVLLWLQQCNFSKEWQVTFSTLNLHGLPFLELGSKQSGRGNSGLMHQKVYPQLLANCKELGTPWDPSREREEGKRMRRLIRNIITSKTPLPGHSHVRKESGSFYPVNAAEVESPNTPLNPPGPSFSNRQGQSRSAPKNIDVESTRRIVSNTDIPNIPQIESPGSYPNSAGAVTSASPHSTHFGHRSRKSTDSVSSNAAIYGSGVPPEAARMNLVEALAGSRRNGHEPNRLSPSDPEPMSARDSKGLRNFFGRKKKHQREDGEETDSPTSPALYKSQSLGSRSYGSELSLDMSRTRAGHNGRYYILITKDGWNYRMCDVTDYDSSAELRQIVCQNLGIGSPEYVKIYITELGKADHDEPLDDTKLLAARRTRADSYGSLKLLVRSEFNPSTTSHVHLDGLSPDEELYAEHNGSRTTTSTLDSDSREYREAVERKQREYLARRQQGNANRKPEDGVQIIGRTVDFDQPRLSPYDDKKTDHPFEDRKPVPVRNPPALPSNPSATLIKVNSLKKKPMHNGRPSFGGLENVPERPGGNTSMPHRRAFSSTSSNSSSMMGSVMTGLAMNLKSVANISPHSSNGSVASPPALSQRRPSQPLAQTQTQAPAPAPAPAPEPPKASGPDLDFVGNDVSFATASPTSEAAGDDSDDDSDDGLFAVPIAARQKAAAAAAAAKRKSSDASAKRPSLHVDVDGLPARARKGLSVSFGSPPGLESASDSAKNSEQDEHANSRSSSSRRTPGTPSSDGTWESTDDSKLNRRKSFVDKGVWANRPPTDDLLNHLDDFFPNLDLDLPIVEENDGKNGIIPSPISEVDESAPSSSPVHLPPILPPLPASESLSFIPESRAAKYNDNDTLGSDESTLKANNHNRDSYQSVAHRSISRASGLGRLKSIRQVARDTHEAQKRYTTVSQATPDRATTLARRKSTKMFNANIVQIKPQRDSILFPPIPQETAPKRQTTFRWFKGQLIGKGSYGRVYLGMNATTGEFLAVKEVDVNPKAAQGDKNKIKEMVAGLDQEIDTMQHLDHVNIVQYLGCERKETSISIFLEYIPGGSVGSCLKKHGRFEEPLVSSLTRQTLSGLAYLHREGILHRDLKADNILLDLDGTCKISDFGISKKTDNIYGNDKTNSMQGSVFWMAPEVINPPEGKGYSAKVDIWSLGCVVLEMFVGKRPWGNEEAVGAIYKLANGERPPIPEDLNPSPVALAFMLDCFQVNPYDRPTAEKLLAEHPFCEADPDFQFDNTELYAKINPGKV